MGNISGDNAEFRDTILSHPEIMQNIQKNVLKSTSISLLRNIAWAVSNFCRTTNAPLSENVSYFITLLLIYLKN